MEEATVVILVNLAILSKIGLPSLLDNRMTAQEQYGDMLEFFGVGVRDLRIRPLDGILSY